jgi:MFS family permease
MTRWLPGFTALETLSRDGWLLFATRATRLFAYGLLSVILVLYLAELGFSPARIGLLLALTLLGDTVISLGITTHADRLGRRHMLVAGAALMVLAALLFAVSDSFAVLLLAATLGVISPSGGEVGPFLSLEQAALAQLVSGERRTDLFAWYNLIGAFATAIGALCGGLLVAALQAAGVAGAAAYRPVILLYGILGLVLVAAFLRVSAAIEVGSTVSAGRPQFGLHRSRGTVLRLSALFAMDSFGGGLIIQSVLAYWLHLRFAAEPALLGVLFLAANVLAGLSYLAAGALARRVGLVNTMVFSHLPSNLLLFVVPLMPTFASAATVLLMRFAISQMDVPTRQAYLMAVVNPDERAAAAGVTGVARSVGAALSPGLASVLIGTPGLASLPFFLAGAIKAAYDLLLYRGFIHLRPDHELRDGRSS